MPITYSVTNDFNITFCTFQLHPSPSNVRSVTPIVGWEQKNLFVLVFVSVFCVHGFFAAQELSSPWWLFGNAVNHDKHVAQDHLIVIVLKTDRGVAPIISTQLLETLHPPITLLVCTKYLQPITLQWITIIDLISSTHSHKNIIALSL